MPVIKHAEEIQKRKALKGMIKTKMEVQQVTKKQMAALCGCAEDTFPQKVNHPERFTYPQLQAVFKRLHFSNDEILQCM